MTIRKRVPSEFGVIVPADNEFTWVQQGGGMTCAQREFEGGVYIPIGGLRHRLGKPDWAPDGPNFSKKLRRVNVKEDIPQEEFERLPAKVRRRGNFDGYDEYRNWIDESERYGSIELYDDLRRFTYGLFDLLDSDPRNRWEDSDDLWDTIDEELPFTYERVEDYREYELDYPRPEAAIRWIRITGTKTYKGRAKAEWAEELEGEIVFLMCPNAD